MRILILALAVVPAVAAAAEVTAFRLHVAPDPALMKVLAKDASGWDCKSTIEFPVTINAIDKKGTESAKDWAVSLPLEGFLKKAASSDLEPELPTASLGNGLTANVNERCEESITTYTPAQSCDANNNCTTTINTATETHGADFRWSCHWELPSRAPGAELASTPCVAADTRDKYYLDTARKALKGHSPVTVGGSLVSVKEKFDVDLCPPGAAARDRTVLRITARANAGDRNLVLTFGGTKAKILLADAHPQAEIALCGADSRLAFTVEGDKSYQSANVELPLKAGEKSLVHQARAGVMGRMFLGESLLGVSIARVPAARAAESTVPEPQKPSETAK